MTAIKLTAKEGKLVNYARKAVIKYSKMRHKKGGIDTLYSFLMSNSGKIYDGASFESNIATNICGERHAIANMILKESYKAKIEHIIIVDPIPKIQKNSTPPCGTCRHLILEFGTLKTSVICIQYIHNKNNYTFPKIEKYSIKDLYPHPYKPTKNLWG